MEIKFSKHSINNIRLYEIAQSEIVECLSDADRKDREGSYFVAYRVFVGKFSDLPLKVVYVIKHGCIVIVSAYPLKKSYWTHDLVRG